MRISDGCADILLQREHDCLLMDAFVVAGYTGETLCVLNVYLRVAVLSEVIDGGGSKLRAQMVAGTTPMAKSQYVWPNQGKPPGKELENQERGNERPYRTGMAPATTGTMVSWPLRRRMVV